MAKGKYEQWLEPEGLLKIEAWARDGLTDEQIAYNMGINVATLYRYKKSYCEICEALKRGKDVVDMMVENALLKRALGYSYTEITKERLVDTVNKKRHPLNEDTGELVVTKEVKKEIPPDVTAIIYWLKNRKPEIWKDKQNIEISGELKHEKTKLDDIISQMRAGKGSSKGGDAP